ncbi:MAG: hypothetical protein LBQ38_11490 [Spirochaetaceae bacterium]|jgi:hypothetical protein|nr:hypothetical protein [Spirochaetaceae bacterium]
MDATQAIGEGLTFEKVWAAIQATSEQMKATDELIKENARQMKETDKRVGALTNRFGEMVEYMIVPNLVAKFHELGFEFEKTHRDTEIRDREHDIFTEIDVFLENGDKVMIVETKTKPNVEDINDHIERMAEMMYSMLRSKSEYEVRRWAGSKDAAAQLAAKA